MYMWVSVCNERGFLYACDVTCGCGGVGSADLLAISVVVVKCVHWTCVNVHKGCTGVCLCVHIHACLCTFSETGSMSTWCVCVHVHNVNKVCANYMQNMPFLALCIGHSMWAVLGIYACSSTSCFHTYM